MNLASHACRLTPVHKPLPGGRVYSLIVVLCAPLVMLCNPVQGAEPVEFNRDVRPILSEHCFQCHGPDAQQRKADLRLDQREAAVTYGAIVPGDPGQSELLARILSDDPEIVMPPPRAKKELSAEQKEVLRLWIAEGATYQAHWSFKPLAEVQPPAVENANWPRSPLDFFILRRLEAQGLQPADRTTRERLIRRVSFDLTGLPPTLSEIDAFLADDSPQAYEKVVDRLLQSKRFGERMAAAWLDVARYSDTYGYQVDRDRYVWPWRDWVIEAFNKNMPYDQFVTEQLAGDLLPGASDDQVLATTFNRLHPQKVEGGSTPEEFRVEYVADRVQTFATAFLGLTMECARCHDHKFDPIAQKEYYQLAAFFDNIDEAGLYSFFTSSVPTPTLRLADDATKAKLADIEHRIAQAEAKLQAHAAAREEAFEAWLEQGRSQFLHAQAEAASGRSGTAGSNSGDQSSANSGPSGQAAKPTGKQEQEVAPEHESIPGRIAYLDFEQGGYGRNTLVPGHRGKAVRLTGDDAVNLKVGNFRRFEPFSIALWMNTPDEKERAVVFHRSRAWTDAGSRGYQLLIEEGKLSASLIHFWPGNAIRVKTREKIPTGRWLHVAITYDGSSRAEGLTIYVNGRRAESEVVRDNLYKNITGGGGDHLTIGERFRDRGFAHGLVDEFQVFDRRLTPLEIRHLHGTQSLHTVLTSPAEELTASQRSELKVFYLANADPEYRAQLQSLEELRSQRSGIADRLQEIMVMRAMEKPRQTYVLRRGAYDQRGQQVGPSTPAILPAFPADSPRNRLGLARWLTAENHPLTARVAVNRLWQLIFGEGLVHTPEDFGSQGKPPSHPELLDWLARDFIAGGWDVKRTLKQMVMSATYQQSSRAAPSVRQKDPENRLLSRSPSYRLPAEMLRDQALAASGLLVERIGGPPARPYELEASFKPSKHQKGEGTYRRSVYTYWKRTAPAPVMMSLDASKRDVCRVRRERTSSPLQALVLLNGPQFVEGARALSERLLKQHGEDQQTVLIDLFRTLTSRRPTDDELQVLEGLFARQLERFESHPEHAARYLETGDKPADKKIDATRLAAVTVVANTLFNFDECVVKR